MFGGRLLAVSVTSTIGLGILSCGKASVTSSPEVKRNAATAATSSVPANPSFVAPTSSGLGAAREGVEAPNPSSELGTFQPRLTLPAEEDPELRCAPRIAGMSGLDNGELWIVGMCGLRARVTPSEIIDARVAPQTRRSDGPGDARSGGATCLATPWYDGVLARSATEVYVHGFNSCGTDPNAVWAHPVERFDGESWTASGAHPFELRPNVLVAGVKGPVYGATLACAACEEQPFCNILELGAQGLRKLRECRAPRAGKAGKTERYLSAAVDTQAVLWLSGYRDSWPTGDHPQHFFLRYENGAWSEHPFEDSGTFEVDQAGGLWLFGSSAVWRRQGDEWQPFEPLARVKARADEAEVDAPHRTGGWLTLAPNNAAAPEAVAVRSEHDVWWINAGREVFHFDGHEVRSVPVAGLAPDDLYFPFSELTLAGPRVYLRSSSRVWEWIAPSRTAPDEVRLESRPAVHTRPSH